MNLSYTICLERTAGVRSRQCELMVESLIRSGWSGEIIVIANGQLTLQSQMGVVRVLNIPFPGGGLTACRMRFHAAELIPMDEYDWCLYLDCDLIIRKQLEPYFNHPAPDTDFLVTEIRGRDFWLHPAFGGYLPPEAEADTKGQPAIQSGHLAFRGPIAADLLARWDEIDSAPRSRKGFKRTDQSSQNRLVWECRTGRSPWKVESFPHHFAISPHAEQGRRLGFARAIGAPIWHYWGWLRNQEIRVNLMERELERLYPSEPSLVDPPTGNWYHRKPSENLENVWSFFPEERLVWVCNGMMGYLRETGEGGFVIQWMSPPRSDYRADAWETFDYFPGDIHITGRSFRNGNFTLEKL